MQHAAVFAVMVDDVVEWPVAVVVVDSSSYSAAFHCSYYRHLLGLDREHIGTGSAEHSGSFEKDVEGSEVAVVTLVALTAGSAAPVVAPVAVSNNPAFVVAGIVGFGEP